MTDELFFLSFFFPGKKMKFRNGKNMEYHWPRSRFWRDIIVLKRRGVATKQGRQAVNEVQRPSTYSHSTQ
jgi:hypothetical protein